MLIRPLCVNTGDFFIFILEDNFMGVYEELVVRGLIAQVTDEEEIRELVNSGKAVFILVLTLLPTVCMLVILWRFAL